jgi:hypothetical protein
VVIVYTKQEIETRWKKGGAQFHSVASCACALSSQSESEPEFASGEEARYSAESVDTSVKAEC